VDIYTNRLEEYADFLFFTALNKCGNADEANDLTQETFLAALTFMAKGGKIDNIKAWLTTILNRKYYDTLRRKYRQPTVYIEEIPEFFNDENIDDNIIMKEEAESIRREVAYLCKLYREIIVLHYMKNMNVNQISENLGIPANTVKSRLSEGRGKIKKGIDDMERYSNLSYQPEGLMILCSGHAGLNMEPLSLVNNDLLIQNILIAAYDEPLTEDEIAKQIGVVTAYIEPKIDMLVDNELMKRVGNRVYSDFIIYKPGNQYYDYIPAQQKLIDDNFDLFWNPIQEGLDKLRQMEVYKSLSERKKNKLECLFSAWCLDTTVIFRAGEKIYGEQVCPERPNGGKWIAFGNVKTQPAELRENARYRYYGLRIRHFKDYLSVKDMYFHIYNTSFDGNNTIPLKYNMTENDLVQLLYITSENINPSEAGYNLTFLENIPAYIERGYFTNENGSITVDIPVLTISEFHEIQIICENTIKKMDDNIINVLKKYLKDKAISIPKHLKGVPKQKLYMNAFYAILMMVLYKAKESGYILKDVDYPCPAAALITDKK
jgi:RNA polymerase sigma-70 factor (ECF subfamily)